MAPVDAYHQPSDLPSEIPVFPLRGAILLPRARLPLHVFEPRYLAMVDTVIASHRVIGIIQPANTSHANEESPKASDTPLKPVGCVGRVVSFQELDDGRLFISLAGVCRFRLERESTVPHPFRQFTVDYEPFRRDFEPGEGESSVDRTKLLSALKAYLEANKLETDWNAISAAPTELLVNSLSVISPFGPEEKQALLEAENLKHRAEALVAIARMELAADDRSGGQVQ